jgi:hypothetical protein
MADILGYMGIYLIPIIAIGSVFVEVKNLQGEA